LKQIHDEKLGAAILTPILEISDNLKKTVNNEDKVEILNEQCQKEETKGKTCRKNKNAEKRRIIDKSRDHTYFLRMA